VIDKLLEQNLKLLSQKINTTQLNNNNNNKNNNNNNNNSLIDFGSLIRRSNNEFSNFKYNSQTLISSNKVNKDSTGKSDNFKKLLNLDFLSCEKNLLLSNSPIQSPSLSNLNENSKNDKLLIDTLYLSKSIDFQESKNNLDNDFKKFKLSNKDIDFDNMLTEPLYIDSKNTLANYRVSISNTKISQTNKNKSNLLPNKNNSVILNSKGVNFATKNNNSTKNSNGKPKKNNILYSNKKKI